MTQPNENSTYDLYKPLRNYLRQFPLIESLGVVRAYLQNLQFGEPFPSDVQVDPSYLNAKNRFEKKVYEWELEIIAREIVLNSEEIGKGKTLRNWLQFSTAINKLKDFENETAKAYGHITGKDKNVLLEMYRIAHRQFHWQILPNLNQLTHYYKIFSHPEIDKLIQKNIGLTTKELYTIGLAVTGLYQKKFILFYPPNIEIDEIDNEKFDKFIKHFSSDFDSIKKSIKDSQSYNHDYAYTLNPLRVTPLILKVHKGKNSLMCPIPTYLLRAFTEGVYYQICKDKDFAHPFGESFQEFIGEIIKQANVEESYTIYEEEEYKIGKLLKHSSDWMVSDGTANLFVECKTKKLRSGAKISLIDNQELEEDLNLLADFIVQVYKTISDYRQNHYQNFKNNGKPSFPLIVTLEDWYVFGDLLLERVDEKVLERLEKEGLDKNFLTESPYTLCSSYDFESLMQVIQKAGLNAVLSKKTTGEQKLWAVPSFLSNFFSDEYKEMKVLFPDDHKEIHPTLRK